MTSLYTLDSEWSELQRMVEVGESTPEEVADTLDAMGMEFEQKAHAIGCVLANMKVEQEGLKLEITRLDARADALGDERSKLTSYLLASMQKREQKKIKTPLFTFTYKKPTKVVVIDDEGLLPPECLTEVPASYKVNKKAVKELLNGTDHPAAHLEDSKINLQIK